MSIFRKLLSFPFFLTLNVVFLMTLFFNEKVTSFVSEEDQPQIPALEDILNLPTFQKLLSNPDVPKEEAPPEQDHPQKKLAYQEGSEAVPESVERKRDITYSKGYILPGGNFYTLLSKKGVSHKEIFAILKAVKPVHNLSRIKPGNRYEIGMEQELFASLSYDIDNDLNLQVQKQGDLYTTQIAPIPFELQRVVKEVEVKDNLFNAIQQIGEKPALGFAVADIFAWDIDFFKDVRKGDRLKVVIDKKFRDNKFIGYKKVSAVEYVNRGEKFTAIYFSENNDYYTDKGEPLKKQFLKAPLRFSRISSGFSLNRYHPILKKRVPHYGVDYAAPKGTPVHSVADGEVVYAGRRGPSGKLIRIKHNNTYTTGYCHLNSFAKGLRVGDMVKQGQIIGSVGMTGRATGPHLDYQIRKKGKPIDPLKFDPPKINPISETQLMVFNQIRDEMVSLLKGEQVVFQDTDMRK